MKYGKVFYTDIEIREKLGGLSQGTLANKISRGDPLPPFYKVTGTKTRQWPAEEADAWLSKNMVLGGGSTNELY